MIKPTDHDIGRRVVYRRQAEHGIITSMNEHYVFVLYDGYVQAMATRREDLEWAEEAVTPACSAYVAREDEAPS